MNDFKTSINIEYIMKNLRCNWKVYDPREECNTIEGLLKTILDSKFQKFKQKTKRYSFLKSFVLPEISKGDNIEDHVKTLFQQWNIILDMAINEATVPKVKEKQNPSATLLTTQIKKPEVLTDTRRAIETLDPQQGSSTFLQDNANKISEQKDEKMSANTLASKEINQPQANFGMGNIESILNTLVTNMEKLNQQFTLKFISLEKDVASLATKLENVETKIENLETKLTNVEKEIGASLQFTDDNLLALKKTTENNFTEVKARLDESDKKMFAISKNIGCLYELSVESYLSKSNAKEVTNGLFLKKDDNNNLKFKGVKKGMKDDGWETYLQNTTLSQNNKDCLTSSTNSVEINFCCKGKDDLCEIFEATISNLQDNEKLLAKLLQIERQIRFYESLNCKVSKIGFITPHQVELSSIKKIVDLDGKIFKKVKAKIDSKSFVCIKLGFKSELDV